MPRESRSMVLLQINRFAIAAVIFTISVPSTNAGSAISTGAAGGVALPPAASSMMTSSSVGGLFGNSVPPLPWTAGSSSSSSTHHFLNNSPHGSYLPLPSHVNDRRDGDHTVGDDHQHHHHHIDQSERQWSNGDDHHSEQQQQKQTGKQESTRTSSSNKVVTSTAAGGKRRKSNRHLLLQTPGRGPPSPNGLRRRLHTLRQRQQTLPPLELYRREYVIASGPFKWNDYAAANPKQQKTKKNSAKPPPTSNGPAPAPSPSTSARRSPPSPPAPPPPPPKGYLGYHDPVRFLEPVMIRDDENGGQPTGDEAKHYELAWGPPGEPLDETYRYSLWFTSPSPSSDTFLLSLDSVTHRWFVCLPDPEGEVDNNGDEKKRNNAATPLVLFPRNRVESLPANCLIRFVKQRGTNLWWLTMMHTNTPIIFDSTPTPSDTKEKTLVGASQTGERPTGLYFVDVPGEGPCLEC